MNFETLINFCFSCHQNTRVGHNENNFGIFPGCFQLCISTVTDS